MEKTYLYFRNKNGVLHPPQTMTPENLGTRKGKEAIARIAPSSLYVRPTMKNLQKDHRFGKSGWMRGRIARCFGGRCSQAEVVSTKKTTSCLIASKVKMRKNQCVRTRALPKRYSLYGRSRNVSWPGERIRNHEGTPR
jgi:hypothetical protein